MKKNLESIVNVVIGTAGHIDHGKSTLVEKLTGIHPDRLPEEKARGLTIDLGFSRLTLKSGQRVGIIDVPGHERLVKNMVAGATGIDIVLLVVAADDGVMPQTKEHVAIMQLLGLQHGIVAVTKIDLVDPELLELVEQDVRETLRGTFLEKAAIVPVSSITGAGIDRLLETIHDEVTMVPPRDSSGIFRMPIQRVFSAKGFGTVVTGVPVSGRTKPGEVLEIVPGGGKGKVRGLHAYGEPIDMARAGHSAAINLTDVDYRQVHRGMVLTEPGYFRPAALFEARFRYLATNKRPLESQTMIRLHMGTIEALGKIFLLEKRVLEPGDETFVQFRLDEPAVAAPGDRFVVRLHSPLETIGGGELLGSSRRRLKTGKAYVVDHLRETEKALGDPRSLIRSLMDSTGYEAVAERDLAVAAGLRLEETREAVDALVREGALRKASRAGFLLSTRSLQDAEAKVLETAEGYFRKNPRRLFLDKLKLRQVLNCHEVFFQDLISAMESRDLVHDEANNHLRFRDHGPRLRAEDETIRADILAALKEAPFSPPSPAEIASRGGWSLSDLQELLVLLEEEGEVLRLADDVYILRSAVEEARQRLRGHLERQKTMTASDARGVLGSTRKYVIPLLEYLDREGLTIRRGDLRELRSPGP